MLTGYAKLVPIFWGHGMDDPLVEHEVILASAQFLTAQGIRTASGIGAKGLSVNFYRGVEHSMNMEELIDLKTFLAKIVPSS